MIREIGFSSFRRKASWNENEKTVASPMGSVLSSKSISRIERGIRCNNAACALYTSARPRHFPMESAINTSLRRWHCRIYKCARFNVLCITAVRWNARISHARREYRNLLRLVFTRVFWGFTRFRRRGVSREAKIFAKNLPRPFSARRRRDRETRWRRKSTRNVTGACLAKCQLLFARVIYSRERVYRIVYARMHISA